MFWQEIRTKPSSKKLNPNGKIPFVTLNDGNTLAEANAILGFLAAGTPWLPTLGIKPAKTYEWFFSNNTVMNPLSPLRGLFSIIKNARRTHGGI